MKTEFQYPNEFALFLGCIIPTRLPHVERSARFVLERLGIQLHEMENVTCCGDPIATQSLSVEMWLTIAARNLCVAEQMGKDIITICSGCFEVLRTAYTMLHDDQQLRENINANLSKLNMQYTGTSRVYHFTEVLSEESYLEKIRTLTIRPLDNLKISAHYGCHLIRPSELLKFENPERPNSMDKILHAIGAITLDTSEKLTCCGYCLKLDESVGEKLVSDKIIELQENSIDAMSVVCPSCFIQYNQKQKSFNKNLKQHRQEDEERKKKDVELQTPILFLTEYIALAFGLAEKDIGLKRRAIKPAKLIVKLS